MIAENDKKEFLTKYDRGTHLIGRASTAICTVLFIGAPFVIGLYLGAMPDMSAVLKDRKSVV